MYTFKPITDPEDAWLLWQAGLLRNTNKNLWRGHTGRDDYYTDYESFLVFWRQVERQTGWAAYIRCEDDST